MFSFCNITLFIFFKYTSTTATDPYGHPLSLPHALPIYISRLPCLCAAARQGEHEKRILYLELPAKRRGKLTDEAQPEPEAKRGRFKASGKARRRRVVKRLGVPSGKRGWTREENPDRIALAGTDAIGQPVPRPRRANDGREQPADDALQHFLGCFYRRKADGDASDQLDPALA